MLKMNLYGLSIHLNELLYYSDSLHGLCIVAGVLKAHMKKFHVYHM